MDEQYLSKIQEAISACKADSLALDKVTSNLNIGVLLDEILEFNGSLGIDVEWIRKATKKLFEDNIRAYTRSNGIYSIVRLLKDNGCSYRQSSMYLAEWLSISPRRVLQIFQEVRSEYSDMEEQGSVLSDLVQCQTWMCNFMAQYDVCLPKSNQHALLAMKKIIKSIEVANHGLMSHNPSIHEKRHMYVNFKVLESLQNKGLVPRVGNSG